MSRYYYPINSFPPVVLGVKPEISYEEVRDTLELNLSAADWEQVVWLQRPADIRNIRALWLGEPLDPKGNLDEKELGEALLIRDGLPQFVLDFLERYELEDERIRYFPSLFASLYAEGVSECRGFLHSYYVFQREMRLSLTALRAKRGGRDLARELQFEDLTDPFVALLLAQKEEAELVLPQEYEELKAIFLDNQEEPRSLYKQILQFSFARIEEMEEGHPFAMDQILGYLARLAIVESWEQLDDERGRAVLEQVGR